MTAQPHLGTTGDPYTTPFRRLTLPGHASWGRAPRHHSGAYVYPGRAVLVLAGHQWPHEPETCPVPETSPGQWHLDDQVLACPGCGLDVT